MEGGARTAFVTGGSGFIGGRLIQRLVGDGWRVRGLARSDRSAAVVAERGAEPVRGDLDDARSMRAGAEGCELAFHAAAHLGEWGTRAEFERGNVIGTRNALDGARAGGVRRSSTSAPRRA
jgi:nucleoside-diphosphate-sugar epimerase